MGAAANDVGRALRPRLAAALLAVVVLAGCGGASRHPGSPRLPPAAEAAADGAAGPVAAADGPLSETIGRSVQGRPLTAVSLGDPGAPDPVLLVGDIHGDEPAGIAIARWLIAHGAASEPRLWVVPALNPDGVAAGTRQNAHRVDLNRNFPYRWAPLYRPGDQQYQGPRPLSEPESRAARRLIDRVQPGVTIWLHQPLGLVDQSGGDPAVVRRFAALAGLPVRELTRYPGSAPTWQDHAFPGDTAFVVELPAGRLGVAAVTRYARAVLSLAGPSG